MNTSQVQVILSISLQHFSWNRSWWYNDGLQHSQWTIITGVMKSRKKRKGDWVNVFSNSLFRVQTSANVVPATEVEDTTTCRTHMFPSPHYRTLLRTCLIVLCCTVTDKMTTVVLGQVQQTGSRRLQRASVLKRSHPIFHVSSESAWTACAPFVSLDPDCPVDWNVEHCKSNSAGGADVWLHGQLHSSHTKCMRKMRAPLMSPQGAQRIKEREVLAALWKERSE